MHDELIPGESMVIHPYLRRSANVIGITDPTDLAKLEQASWVHLCILANGSYSAADEWLVTAAQLEKKKRPENAGADARAVRRIKSKMKRREKTDADIADIEAAIDDEHDV